MSQLTIYLDEETRRRIETAAKKAQTSVSSWVKQRLLAALETSWPEGFFDLIGSLEESDIERPPQPSFDDDSRRERLGP